MKDEILIFNGKKIIPLKDKPKDAKKTDWYIILPGDFYREEHYVNEERTKVVSFACSIFELDKCEISLDEFRALAFESQGIKKSYGLRSVTYPEHIFKALLEKFKDGGAL